MDRRKGDRDRQPPGEITIATVPYFLSFDTPAEPMRQIDSDPQFLSFNWIVEVGMSRAVFEPVARRRSEKQKESRCLN